MAELTPLQRRLKRVAAQPGRAWLTALENVPRWEVTPPLPATDAASGPWEYAGSQGEEALLAEVVGRERARGHSVSVGNVLITHGALFGLALVLRQLRAAGVDTVLCRAPVLGSVHLLIGASGLRPVVTEEEDLVAAVRRLADAGGVAVYVNSPHNPTGSVVDPRIVEALLEGAGQRPVRVVVDAVYDAFDFTPREGGHPVRLPVGRPGLFVVNSMSKNYGAPGLRVGWILADPRAVRELTVRLEFETIAVPGVSQLWAARLIRHGNGELVERVRAGRALVTAWWAGLGHDTSVLGPGGPQAWVPVPERDGSFADAVMEEFGLVLVGSESYVGARGAHVRVPVGGPDGHLREVLRTLGNALGAGALRGGEPPPAGHAESAVASH